MFIYECSVCHLNLSSIDNVGFFDTHHINHQKYCIDGFVKNKPHIPKNSKANLVVLCKKCHHDVHHDQLEIDGYKKTILKKVLK